MNRRCAGKSEVSETDTEEKRPSLTAQTESGASDASANNERRSMSKQTDISSKRQGTRFCCCLTRDDLYLVAVVGGNI